MPAKRKSNGLTTAARSKRTKNIGLMLTQKSVEIYLAVMLSIFWVYNTNALFNLKLDKYNFVCTATFIASAVFAVLFISALLCGVMTKTALPGERIKKLCTTDIAMLLFFISVALSAYFSEYKEHVIDGDLGRYNGLKLILAYLFMYIMVSYFYKGAKVFIYLYMCFGFYIGLIGILNNFGFDPLDYINRIREDQMTSFISTIGNINFFATFVCVFFAVSFGMFMISEHIFEKIFSIACLSIASGALIAANSDLGFFAVFVFMGVMSIYSFKNIKRLHRYVIAWLTLTLSMKMMPIVCKLVGGHHVLVETLSEFFMYSNYMYFIIGFFLALTIIFAGIRANDKLFDVPSWFYIIAIVLVALCVVAGAGALYYFSVIDTETNIGVLERYLRFNEKWGTSRGYAWIKSIESFFEFDWVHKLFGSGPDTLSPVLGAKYNQEMLKRFNFYFDSAHNEYIEWLVTLGICGAVSIITFIISAIVRMIRCSSKRPELVVFYGAVMIYSFQALFNISQPLTTTLLFLFAAMGISVSRTVQSDWPDMR